MLLLRLVAMLYERDNASNLVSCAINRLLVRDCGQVICVVIVVSTAEITEKIWICVIDVYAIA